MQSVVLCGFVLELNVMQRSTRQADSSDSVPEIQTGSIHDVLSSVDEEARQRRRLRNRESAARSREKRRQKNSELELTISKLRMKAELVDSLRVELTVLVTRMREAKPER